MSKTIIATPDEPGDELERRRQPFVPDRDRVVYPPLDYTTTRPEVLRKYHAEVRIEVGGQLMHRIVRRACDLEDDIRNRVHDEAQYASLQVVLQSFLADAIEVRQRYMNPDERGQQ